MNSRRLISSMQPLRALPNPAKRSLPHAEAAAEAPAGPWGRPEIVLNRLVGFGGRDCKKRALFYNRGTVKTLANQGASRFRTIQVCPKDLPAILRQVEHAVGIGGPPQGRKPDARPP